MGYFSIFFPFTFFKRLSVLQKNLFKCLKRAIFHLIAEVQNNVLKNFWIQYSKNFIPHDNPRIIV